MDSHATASPVDASVDPEQVAFYERLAHTWWDRSGPFWPLHRLNTLRAAYLRRAIATAFARDAESPQPLKGLSVLDVGCGGGILSGAMATLGARVHGIDVTARNVEIARQHFSDSALAVRFEAVTADALAARGERYDVVLNMEVVEHVADVPGFMDACARLVRPSGLMAVASINRSLRAFVFAIVGAEYVLGWLPRGTHQWRRFPTPAEIESLLGRSGLAVRERTGVRINPFSRRFSLSSSMAVNYMLVAQRSGRLGDQPKESQ